MTTEKVPNTERKTVLVTGGSGYIGSHIVNLVLQNGYIVRTTVRNKSDASKCDPLYDLQKCVANSSLELFEADLLKAEGWDAAVLDCDFVIHTASPFPAKSPRNADELIKPAVDGTLTVLNACLQSKSVQRVVLTSSIAAVMGNLSKTTDYNESDFTNPDDLHPIYDAYLISKTLAEKAAWDFLEKHDAKFDLVVLNPGFVLGPMIHKTYFTSAEIISRILNRQVPLIPKVCLPIVDVRDVALAHINALTCKEAAGKRFILVNRSLWFEEIVEILKQEFQPMGYFMPSLKSPRFLVLIGSFFDKSLKWLAKTYEKWYSFDNNKMLDVLKIEPIDIKKTICDMSYSLIENGLARKTTAYIGPKSTDL